MLSMSFEELKAICDSLLNDLPERNRDIVQRRFGIGYEEPQTLQTIGDAYKITRERVRQLEEKKLDSLRKSSKVNDIKIKKTLAELKSLIDRFGGLRREDKLEGSVLPADDYKPYLFFLLSLKPENFQYFKHLPEFYPCWQSKKKALALAEAIVRDIESLFITIKEPVPERDLYELAKDRVFPKMEKKIPAQWFYSYLETSKLIEKNAFDKYGLVSWEEIIPKNIGDKIFIVLKEEQKPLHFRDIKSAIEKIFNEQAAEVTVHNSLIRDPRFVLVGRGMYALKDWGYKEGSTKEIIEHLLSTSGPLFREEIIAEVKKQKLVQDSTIILALYDIPRNAEGRYYIERY